MSWRGSLGAFSPNRAVRRVRLRKGQETVKQNLGRIGEKTIKNKVEKKMST
ncbi:hypothetical protein HMPREF3198_00545 [Winkia neuii]|nr:hypothetical protein HMPREF3198_00545 [Winkia neuii]